MEADEFVVALRPQRVWSSLVAWDLFLTGSGAGLFFLASLLRTLGVIAGQVFVLSGWLGLALVGAGGVVLMVDLGAPSQFLRVFSRPRVSWVSRGAWTMMLFAVSGTLVMLPTVPGLTALPWRAGTPAGMMPAAVAVVLAFALMAYTGLLLSSWNSIPLWNTPLLPLLFVTSCLLGASGVMLALAAATGSQAPALGWLAVLLILIVSLQLLLYLMVMGGGTAAARESVRLLISGRDSMAFLGGVGLVGLVLPLLLLLSGLAFGEGQPGGVGAAGASALLTVSGLAILVGAYQLRSSILKAGVFRA